MRQAHDKHERTKHQLDQLTQQLEKAKQHADSLQVKLTRESDLLKETRESHKTRLKEIEAENMRLKGAAKAMKK